MATPKDVTTVSFERTVHCDAGTAFQQFREHAWLRTLGPQGWTKIIEPGDAATHVGETRAVPGGLHERIVAYNEPEYFEYSVVAGPFPVDYHLGRVTFTEFAAPSGEKCTRVDWTIKFKPKMGMYLAVVGVIKASIPIFIGNFESNCNVFIAERKKAQASG